jgi:hypothetical protein
MSYLGAVNASMLPTDPAMSPAPVMSVVPEAPPPPPPPPVQSMPEPVPTQPDGANFTANTQMSSAPLPPAPEPNMSVAAGPPPPPPPAGPSAGPTSADIPQAKEHPFPLVAAGGSGVIPAHEVDMRGPSLRGAQGWYNQSVAGTIGAVADNSMDAADREYDLALDQERQAKVREAAAVQAQAEREDELEQARHDFTQSSKALGQFAFKPDGGFWESRTTGQKIAGMFSFALNGFMAGGGRPVPDLIGQGIDRSIRAQEQTYNALKDTANAKQNAFSMAVQKYGSPDAARHMVHAAALEGLQAQAAQMAAMNRGTEVGNRANMAFADLEQQKMNQIAQGVRFIQPQSTGRRWVDPRTGLIYSEAEAKAMHKEMRGEEFKREEIGLNTAGDVIKEGVKAGATSGKQASDEASKISAQLQSAGVPAARHSLETSLALFNKSKGGVAEAALRGSLPPLLASKMLSEDANAREQAFELARADLIHALTGAGMSEKERDNYYNMMGAASSPEARIRTLNMGLEKLKAIEKNAKAGASPEVQARFDRQREEAEGAPPVAPKGATGGWQE